MRSVALSLIVLLLACAAPAPAQRGSAGRIMMPATSCESPKRGKVAHTNHLILMDSTRGLGPGGGMIPAQMRSFYGADASPSTGSEAIAIVDAFHYPTALSDFNVFSATFDLPVETSNSPTASTNRVFQVVYARGRQPAVDGGWSQEMALDIEWAHAMAPTAKIVLVEAASNSFAELLHAVDVATKLPGVREVSMSWSANEFRGETFYDGHFTNKNVVYFAASGDTGGSTQYPAASPYVVAVGGTSVATDINGDFVSETGWSGSGGGPSRYERKPSYQVGIPNTPLFVRSVPDVSCDADPFTGVSVYDSTPFGGLAGWMVFGGTSVSCPCVAALTNGAGHFRAGSIAELTSIYKNRAIGFRDITVGFAWPYSCLIGWDFITGVGSPVGPEGI